MFLAWGMSARAAPPALSADQQRRVDAGEIVLLDTLPPGAGKSSDGGTAIALVAAPAAVVWDILVDVRNHPAIYPRVVHAEPTRVDARHVRVRYTLAVGPFPVVLHVDKYPDPARRRVEWRLAEDRPSRLFSENSGYWQVDALGDCALVTYAVATRTLFPAFLTRGAQRDSLVATVEAVRRKAREVVSHATRCSTVHSLDDKAELAL
jgi:hypothetical protein